MKLGEINGGVNMKSSTSIVSLVLLFSIYILAEKQLGGTTLLSIDAYECAYNDYTKLGKHIQVVDWSNVSYTQHEAGLITVTYTLEVSRFTGLPNLITDRTVLCSTGNGE